MTFTIQIISKDGITIDLGKVKSWAGDKNANLEIISTPTQNIDFQNLNNQGTIIYDINGPTKGVTITSDLTGAFDVLNATIKKAEDLVDGKQTQGTSHILRSNYVTNDSESGTVANTKDLKVKVNSVRHEWVIPGLNKVKFSITITAGR